jgi:uncharacterized UBP type Zn finger protein
VAACSHLESIEFTDVPEEIAGCEDCLEIGGRWMHLRRCTSCGRIACCDNSPNRHATAHAAETGHPVIRSVEPNEQWYWCYVDEIAFVLDSRQDHDSAVES